MKILLIFIFLFIISCSSSRLSNNHGLISLQAKYDKIIINKTNKNDILKIIGPPSSISNFDKSRWFYIETKKTNQSLFKLGIQKIEKNNILIVKFDNKGILNQKKILDLNDMNDVKYVKKITSKEYEKNNTLYKIFSSIREKANAPVKNRAKNRK
tara:strand:+ start:12 stop:476 length:465 start_codon:yes stop_codon:yes gene_type:complete